MIKEDWDSLKSINNIKIINWFKIKGFNIIWLIKSRLKANLRGCII